MDSSWVGQRSLSVNIPGLLLSFGIVTLTSLATVMVATNPTQAAYEAYATREAVNFLNTNVCAEAPTTFGLRRECKTLLARHRSRVHQFIADNTTAHNFLFFSIYTTELSIASFAPTYEIEAVGAFNQFHVYEALPE